MMMLTVGPIGLPWASVYLWATAASRGRGHRGRPYAPISRCLPAALPRTLIAAASAIMHNVAGNIGGQHRPPCGCRHAAAKIVGCKRCIEMEGHAMSLIRNGYAVSTRRGFPGVLFSALLAFALFDPGVATAQEVKQIKLTERQIQGLIAAHDDMVKLYDGPNPD